MMRTFNLLKLLLMFFLSAVDLLINIFLFGNRARIMRIRSWGPFPWTRTVPRSPAMRLPHEIIQLIMAHLVDDLPTICSCSRTCHSWYIAAIPHIRPSLLVSINHPDWGLRWPYPIHEMHNRRLLPYVGNLRIFSFWGTFSPNRFNSRILRQFLGLTNVQVLEIDCLDLPSFMPTISQHFCSFLPTVKSLCLRVPTGSNRQIIFFIGLFQHLENLALIYHLPWPFDREPEDLTLIPPFTPPLRGHLELQFWLKCDFFQEMVHLFGELRFSSMSLRSVNDTGSLLRACANTLKALRLYPGGFPGLGGSLGLGDINLSSNLSLQSLQIPVETIDGMLRYGSMHYASTFLKDILSTILSPSFSRVELIYSEDELRGGGTLCSQVLSYLINGEETPWHLMRFNLLREIRRARYFQLVLRAHVPRSLAGYAVQTLKEVVAEEKARGSFDFESLEPRVTFTHRGYFEPTVYLGQSS